MVAAAMIFASPYWLLLLPALAVAAYLFWRLSRRHAERRLGLFVSPGSMKEAVPSVDRRFQIMRFALPTVVIGLVVIALARPLTGPKAGQAERKGVDFVIALDVSKSMWAEDVKPNRLAAVKKELSEWLKQASGDRVGLVVFAGEAQVQAPITFDYQAFGRVLDITSPRSISQGGTNIPKAIEVASKLLTKSGLDTRALVIISDGENLDGDAVGAARTAHAANDLTIFTVGIGTAAGEKVPIMDRLEAEKFPAGQRPRLGYMRNEYGTEVVSRVDEHALRTIATAGGGSYEPFVSDGQFFQRLRDKALLPLAKKYKILNVQDYHEWFQVPIVLAILLLMLEPLIPRMRRSAAGGRVGVDVVRPDSFSGAAGAPVVFARKAAKPAPVSALVVFLLFSHALSADDLDDRVSVLLKENKPADAVALIKAEVDKTPDDSRLVYNYGVTLYQAGQLEEAIEVFQNLKISAADDAMRARILFQLGNVQFRLGERLGKQPGALVSMERALAFYDELIAIRSTGDIRHNREETVKALTEILKKVAADRLQTADDLEKRKDSAQLSRVLREALDTQERLTALDPKDKQASAERDKTKRRLADSLMADAAKQSAEADKMEARNDTAKDRQVLGQREQAIESLKSAQAQAPDDKRIEQAIQEQKTKMSNLMTRRAEEQITPALAKDKLKPQELTQMNRARENLEEALELDPNNQRAEELKTQAEKRLEKDFLAQAGNHLEQAMNRTVPVDQLKYALGAEENFQKALEVNPESQPAKEGLAKTGKMLPELHAAAAESDLAEAEKLMESQNAQSQQNLKKAVGYLETSTQNFSRSLALQSNEAVQKRSELAEQMLGEARNNLDESRQANADSNEGEGREQKGRQGKPQPPQNTQIYTQRQPPTTPGSVSSGEFWNKNKKDW